MRALHLIYYFLLIVSASGSFELIADGGSREEGLDNYVSATWWLKLFPYAINGLGLILIFIETISSRMIIFKYNKIFLILVIYLCSSFLWSEYTAKSFSASFSFFLFIATFSLLHRFKNIETEFIFLYFISSILIWISLINIVFFPAYGISIGENHAGKWQGAFAHKNSLGIFCVTFIWLGLNFNHNKWCLYRFTSMLLASILIFGSQSYTSIIGLIALPILWLTTKSSSLLNILYKFRLIFLIFILCFMLSLIWLSLSNNGISVIDKDDSFSGRNFIWAWVANRISENPLFGYGFGSIRSLTFENPFSFYHSVGFLVGTAHNGFFELIHDGGFFAIIVFIAYILNSLKNTNQDNLFRYLSFISIFFTINSFESRGIGINIFTLIFLIFEKHSTTNKIFHIKLTRGKI